MHEIQKFSLLKFLSTSTIGSYIFTYVVCMHIILEGKSIKSNAEKNKIAARKWKELTAREKDEYFKQAKEQVGLHQAAKGSWKEASRIIKNLESNVGINC